jgi:NhaP-type Na+/H+ or K+/H+ antiporter
VLIAYAATLMLAVLVSERAHRTVMSTAVLFLAAGLGWGILVGTASTALVHDLADVTLVAVLFSDGMRASAQELRTAWRLPGRALLFGFPLTVGGTAVVGVAIAGLSWPEALLVGAVLAPTDPVFASAIVGREEIPGRLRHLLNVESGVNDGLALPLVVALIAWLGPTRFHAGTMTAELTGGIALGVAIPWIALRLERSRFFAAANVYERLLPISVGVLVYAIASAAHANEYLAAFAAGVTVASLSPEARRAFAPIGEVLTELLKLGAVLVFGTLIVVDRLFDVGLWGWAFSVLVLVAVRPVALAIALAGSGLPWRERLAASWFGPKGFASVVYGLLVAASGLPRAQELFHLAGATILLSIVAHSSSDVLVARWFRRSAERARSTRLEAGAEA